jgi:sRNA-binding protein
MTTDTPNPSNKKAEQARGFKEGFHHFEALRARWPKAFPLKSHEIRPLATGARQALVEEFGWSPGYAQGVLAAWKMRLAYCQAILRYPTRINLDGSASDEEVGDQARALAQKQLERHAARRAEKAQRAEQDRLRAAAEASAEAQAPEPAPNPADAQMIQMAAGDTNVGSGPPTMIPEAKSETASSPQPPKSGKLIVAGSAAMQAALKRRLASGAMTTEVLKTVAAPSTSRKREQQAR